MIDGKTPQPAPTAPPGPIAPYASVQAPFHADIALYNSAPWAHPLLDDDDDRRRWSGIKAERLAPPPDLFVAPRPKNAPGAGGEEDIPLFNSKLNLELWKAVEHSSSYGVANGLASLAQYHYRVATPELHDVFLYDRSHAVGGTLIDAVVPDSMREHLDDPRVDEFLTMRGNHLDNLSSGIKMFFQLPNLAMSVLMALRPPDRDGRELIPYVRHVLGTHLPERTRAALGSEVEKPVFLTNVGNVFKSAGYLVEKSSIISAGLLYNAGFATLGFPGLFSVDALDLLFVSQVAILVTSPIFAALSLPLLWREGRKEAGIGGIFMESANTLAAVTSNIIMSGFTLYAFEQAKETKPPEDLYKILKQSFEMQDTLLWINRGLMIGMSVFLFTGLARRFLKARRENDLERQYITAPLLAAAACSGLASPFLADPSLLPLGAAISTLGSAFFASSMFIKHRKFLRKKIIEKLGIVPQANA